jgi:DNA adenine methylase
MNIRPARIRKLLKYSPLRYPGGKGRLAPFVKEIIALNKLADGVYVEPYAGGAGIALELLLQEYVSEIYINDVSRPVWAFWKSVITETESLIRLIRKTPLTVAAWDKQKKVFSNAEHFDDLLLGFATFYLNRTNRSGIFDGGIIGGRAQTGPWQIDARYNATELIHRIEAIATVGSRIHLSKQDAKTFLRQGFLTWPRKTLIYLDPPYYTKGKDLYLDFYEHEDHEYIAAVVKKCKHNWIVSYDNVAPIRAMYSGSTKMEYSLFYSARSPRIGSEVMFFSDGLKAPAMRSPMKNIRKARMSRLPA